MSYTISFDNDMSAEYSDDKVYVAFIAYNRNNVFCWIDVNGNLNPMKQSDLSHPFGDAKNCMGGDKFANYSFELSALPKVNDKYAFTIPDDAYINSGLIFVSLGEWLPFCPNSFDTNGDCIGFAPPSVTNPGLQGYGTYFQTVEITYNKAGTQTVHADTTTVDAMGFPITLTLTDTSNNQQIVGFSSKRSTVIEAFQNCSDTNFQSLVINSSGKGKALRILSPEHAGQDSNGNNPAPGLNLPASVVTYFTDFYSNYIDQCWSHYTNTSLTIYISGDAYTGKVTDNVFNWYSGTELNGPVVLALTKPKNWEVMMCKGVFAQGNATQMNIEKFIVAAMYRTVFMETPTSTKNSWGSNAMIQKYYTNEPVNHFAKIMHTNSKDQLCYAFGFDDVCDQSSSVTSGATKDMNIKIENWG